MAERSKEAKRSIRRRRRRRLAWKLNSFLFLLLGGLMLAMINYLSERHHYRADLNRSTFYDLAEQTHALLGGLSNRVDVAVVFVPDDGIYEDINFLLDVYCQASDQIRIERVDPNINLARARQLQEQHNLTDDNVVIFTCGDRTEVVRRSELVEATYDSQELTTHPTTVYFRGELMFSSAIKAVAEAVKPVIYVLQGHGEGDMESFDEFTGYSDIAQALRHDHLDVRPFVLGVSKSVPQDAAAVVLAGPAHKISQPELDILREYLEASGRMLLLLEPKRDAGLRPLLADWGIAIHDDVVMDLTRTLTGPELIVTEYGSHAITRVLKGISTMFYLPRSVEPRVDTEGGADPMDKPQAVILIATSQSGWAESDLNQKPALRNDPDEDRQGPVSIAVAVEKGSVAGIDVEIRPTRLVVIGDADFVSNRNLSGGNKDLFLNMVNWLVERDAFMGIAPKPFEMYRLMISRRQIRYLLGVLVGGIPAAVALLGVLVWSRRRA
jgi:ABC-type uncharacterized transport system involved in gliding motility auxiliary subunit